MVILTILPVSFSNTATATNAALTSDLLQVNGDLNINNAKLTGTFTNVKNGDSFHILSATGKITGTFAPGSTTFFVGGQMFFGNDRLDFVAAAAKAA